MIFKLIAVSLCGVLLSLIIKQYKPEFAIFVSVITAVIIISGLIPYIKNIIELLDNMAEKTGIDSGQIKIVLKIIGVAYICNFAADAAKDAGENLISGKVLLGGKIVILTLSMPIVYKLLDTIMTMVNF